MDKLLSVGEKYIKAYLDGLHNDQKDESTPTTQEQQQQQTQPSVSTPTLATAASQATSETSSSLSSLFNLAVQHIASQNHQEPIDETSAVKAHTQAYEKGDAKSMDARSIGSAAALHVLKTVLSSGGKGSGFISNLLGEKQDDPKKKTQGKSDLQSKLIGLAMSEAAKLFDKSKDSSHGESKVTGSKLDAITAAGSTIIKTLVQSQLKPNGDGKQSGRSSGASHLLKLVGKLL